MTTFEVSEVEPGQWLDAIAAHARIGASYLDFIAATDLGGGATEVVALVMAPDASQRVLFRTVVPEGMTLASLVAILPGAEWHEREAAELVGVRIGDADDGRPFFLRGSEVVHPLRRTTALARRGQPWPGAYEPQGAQRARPKPTPGVPDEWTEQR